MRPIDTRADRGLRGLVPPPEVLRKTVRDGRLCWFKIAAEDCVFGPDVVGALLTRWVMQIGALFQFGFKVAPLVVLRRLSSDGRPRARGHAKVFRLGFRRYRRQRAHSPLSESVLFNVYFAT
jgi:hypothetical protein